MFNNPLLNANAHRLVQAWGNALPPLTPGLEKTADDAVAGVLSFHFNGLTPTTVGRSQIDWVGRHHTHQEWRAQLNRFFQLSALASAFQKSGQEKYAQAARDYLADWMLAHPTKAGWEMGRPHDTTLNISIRLGQSQWPGWIGILPVMAASACFDDAFVQDLIASTAVQLDYLAVHLPPVINWRISAADCLLVSGLRLAGLVPGAQGWRELGLTVLNDAYHRQVLPDGAHVERTPSYHSWMTRVMDQFWTLGQAMPELGLAMEADSVVRMYDYALCSTRPNGQFNALHDSQGLRLGMEDNGIAQQRTAFRTKAGLPDVLPPTAAYFPDAGQILLRDGWNPQSTYVTFDATLWGGAHCHLSRNSIQLHAQGRTLLADPGWLTYEGSDPAGAHGKSTRAHNTLNLNGWNQSTTDPSRTCYRHISPSARTPGYDLVASDYEGGYWQGRFLWGFDQGMAHGIMASHNRTMLWVQDLGLIIFDSLFREAWSRPELPRDTPSVEANWQFVEGPLKLDPQAARAVTQFERGNLLMLFPVRPAGTILALHQGQRDPMRGWLPTNQGLVPAPQVCLSASMGSPWVEFVTLALPFDAQSPQVNVEVQGCDGMAKPGWMKLTWDDGHSDEFHWTYRQTIMLGRIQRAGFDTDASIVHLRRDATGCMAQAAAFDATFLAPWDNARRLRPESFALARN